MPMCHICCISLSFVVIFPPDYCITITLTAFIEESLKRFSKLHKKEITLTIQRLRQGKGGGKKKEGIEFFFMSNPVLGLHIGFNPSCPLSHLDKGVHPNPRIMLIEIDSAGLW